METYADRVKMWLLSVSAMFFLFATYFAVQEFRYGAFAAVAEARVTEVKQTTSVGKRPRPLLSVHYAFQTEQGETRREYDTVEINQSVSTGQTVEIQYIPGTLGASRLASKKNPRAIPIFLVSLAVAAVLFVVLDRWVNTDQVPKRRRAKSKKPRKRVRDEDDE